MTTLSGSETFFGQTSKVRFGTERVSRVQLTETCEYFTLWDRALNAYDTPKGDVAPSSLRTDEFKVRGISYPCFYYSGLPTREEKIFLMSQQARYIPIAAPLIEKNCLLCQNIAQSRDAKLLGDEAKDTCILDLGEHLVLPNRYPLCKGASLFLPINHDGSSHPTHMGRNRGRCVKATELEILFEVSDTYDLVVERNHIFDAMSIPAHDHFHLIPHSSGRFPVLDLQFGANVFQETNIATAEGTPFSTLIVSNISRKTLAYQISSIIEGLERDQEIFTLIYYQGLVMVSPRWSRDIGRSPVVLGSSVPVHGFDPSDEVCMERILKFVPLVGEYDWGSLLRELSRTQSVA